MIEIVIKYDPSKAQYLIYEPSTDTMMASGNLTEALVLLSEFLINSGFATTDILQCDNISYHIDSATMKSIVEGNLNLIKRLQTAPSGFMMSSARFGGGLTANGASKKAQPTWDGGGSRGRSRSNSGGMSGAKGFKDAFKKFNGGNL